MPHNSQAIRPVVPLYASQNESSSEQTNSNGSEQTYTSKTMGLPQLPGHSARKLSDAGVAQYHLKSDQCYEKNCDINQKPYSNDPRQGSRQVQFSQDVSLNRSYSLRSPTLGSAYSNNSPRQNAFPPDSIFETLKDNPTPHHPIQPIPNFPQSNLGSEQSCWTSQHSSEGRMSRFTRSSSSTRPLKSSSTACQRETEAQLAWLGYKQELFRDWDFWSSFSLSVANIGLVPGAFWSLPVAINIGGPIVMIWGYLLSMVFMCVLNAVLAEMSSAYPVTGAMFTWTFKLARANPRFRDWARLLSWIIGFLLMISHILVQVQLAMQFVDVFISVFTASELNWIVKVWQRYALIAGWLILCGLIGCTTTARSPITWKIAGVVNAIASVSMCIALLATGKQQRSFRSVFTHYENRSPLRGSIWVFIYGSSHATLCVGSEPSAHLAEETKEAASTVPRVMFWSMVFSYVSAFAMNLAVIKVLVPGHHRTRGTWPVVDLIFLHCPKPVAQFVVACLLITMLLEDMSQTLAASRFFWALSRDNAIPFAKYWHQVSTKHRIPRRATILLSLISVAVAATCLEKTRLLTETLMSGTIVMITMCYIVPIALYLSGEKDAMERDGRNVWTLRGWSRPLTWISLIFLMGIIVLYSSPSSNRILPRTWSWSPLVTLGLVFLAMVTWMVYGQAHFAGPVKSLTIWTAGQEVELPNKMARTLVPAAAVMSKGKVSNRSIVTLERSAPNQTLADHQTFNLPDAYVSYTSEGSMWCDTQIDNQ